MLKNYINQSNKLNHLDISSIDFTPWHVKEVAECVANSHSLLAVHMNNLGLNNDLELVEDVLESFGIENSKFNSNKNPVQNLPIFNIDTIK